MKAEQEPTLVWFPSGVPSLYMGALLVLDNTSHQGLLVAPAWWPLGVVEGSTAQQEEPGLSLNPEPLRTDKPGHVA